MTALESKKNQLSGKLNQAKGVVHETLGELTNDETMRLAGKKEQIIGKIQSAYGDQWVVRNSSWVLAGLTVALTASLIALFLPRIRNSNS